MADNLKNKPHAVVAVISTAADEVQCYRCVPYHEGIEPSTTHDPKTQYTKVVGLAPTSSLAVSLQKKIEAFSLSDVKASAIKAEPFDASMSPDPRVRAAVFRTMPAHDREHKVYSYIVGSGLGLKDVAKYLGLKPAELSDLIDPVVTDAASSELKLKIGAALLDATRGNSPAALTAKIYASKTIAGFKEDGSNSVGSDAAPEVSGGLLDGLTVEEAHRDQDGNTIAPPTTKTLARGSK